MRQVVAVNSRELAGLELAIGAVVELDNEDWIVTELLGPAVELRPLQLHHDEFALIYGADYFLD